APALISDFGCRISDRLMLRAQRSSEATPPPSPVTSPSVAQKREILFVDATPTAIRIEARHRASELRRVASEILLKHNAVLINDERRDAGGAILRRKRDEPEAADHFSIHDIVIRAARSMRALLCQDSIKVSVV